MAQNPAVAARITTNVDESSLTALRGNVPLLARAQYDQGEASPSTELTHMRLVLARSGEQQAALDKYLAELQDKSSPNYHKWLTPAQFGKLYGPADSDVAVLVGWLESHGLKVETVSIGRTSIAFNGTVSQVEEAFHTSIHSFLANGTQFYSNITDPMIPTALVPVVKGVAHLNTIQPRPQFQRGSGGRINPQSKRLEPAKAVAARGPGANFTGGSGTSSDPYVLYIVPGDAATIYDTPNSYNANFSSGTSYTGAGVKIGIGGDATINPSIVAAYRNAFLGNSTAPNLNYCTSSSSCSSSSTGTGIGTTDSDEAYIDTELAGGIAPGATIYYYASSDLFTGIEAALDANVVDIFSLSFGDCELNMGTAGNAQLNSLWEQAAGLGIAVTVSTGDSGSAGCDYEPADNSVSEAIGGLAVSGFASTPYNIAVGGTDFYPLVNSYATYASTSQGSSSTYYRTALGYIPESTWNDSTTIDASISENVPLTGFSEQGQPLANIVAGSGGASNCSTVSNTNTCTSGYSKPTWQTGTGVPSDGERDLPDVSLMAGNEGDDSAWLVCDDETVPNGSEYVTLDCLTQSDGNSYFDAYGGTSTATPTFAGILALVEQKYGGRLGQADTELYALFNGSHANAIFHDVTVGNNSVPCSSTLTKDGSCVDNTAGNYYENGYNTTTGYDLATGLGSVDATQLVKYWSSGTGSAAATVGVTPTPNPVTTVEGLDVLVTVSGGSGTPTGKVTLSGGGYTSAAETLNSSGSYTFDIAAGSLAIGDDTLTVTYSGDSTYAATTYDLATVQVNGLAASVSVNPSSTSINSNQQLTVSGTVTCTGTCTGSPTPAGTVTLSGGGYTSPPQTLSGGSYSFTTPFNSLSAGSDTLAVTYSGNSTYDSEVGSTSVTVTYVAVLTPTVTVTPASSSVDTAASLNVTVKVTGSGPTPTQTVTLTSGSYNSGPQTLGVGGCTAASCVITIPANSLNASTSDTLTATYSGDPNYAIGVGTATVTVVPSVFVVSVTQPTDISTPGGSTTATITVNANNTDYTGTITFSCTLTAEPAGAIDPPTCNLSNNSTVTMNSGTPTPSSITAMVNTTAVSSELVYPKMHGRGWAGAGGGALLAFLLFLGIPARRRSWRQMLGVVVVMAVLGSLAGCGGGGGTTIVTQTGTTTGQYTFQVTGTGNPVISPAAPPATIFVTVN
jgi:hypothetical protein